MKDFFTAFLERFKHPILYSVITSLVIHNFDYIYLLIVSPFHYAEMKPEMVIAKFVETQHLYRIERFWLPIVTGALFGTFVPSIVDIGYSTFISFAMSFKEKGINWGKRLSWSNKIYEERQIGYFFAEKWEDPDKLIEKNFLSLGSKCLLFKCSPTINIRQIVVYNKKKNRVEQASGINDKLLGIVYEVLPYNLALIVIEGSITAPYFINPLLNSRRGEWALNLTSNGAIVKDQMSENNVNKIGELRFYEQSEGGKELTLTKSNLDIEAAGLSLKHRLFGEDEVNLSLF